MKRTALVAAATTVIASAIVTAGLVGTSSAASADLKISEFRLRGPNGVNDEFVEILNPTGGPVTVGVDDGSAGWSLAASDGVARFTIPNGTVIPAGGHFLGVNSVGYSLGGYPAGNATTATGDATYVTDIADNAGIALFRTSNPAKFTLANRSDAVGAVAEPNLIYREGAGYPNLGGVSIEYSFFRNEISGTPADTGDNATDFVFADTNGTSAGAGQRLGAPGPQNLSAPVQLNGALPVTLLDPLVGPFAAPNMVRDLTSDAANNSTFGTVSIRRTITNVTGAPVTRLRLRAVRSQTFPSPVGVADLRGRTSSDVAAIPVLGGGTTSAVGTTLEGPPTQPNGSGFNATQSVDSIDLATPLVNGASVNVVLLFGVQQTGTFANVFSVEALPASGAQGTPATLTCGTEGCGAAPVAVGDNFPATEDTPLNVPAIGVLAGDTDADADPIHAVLDTNSTHGTVALAANGSFTYTPVADFNGPDSFTYHVSDGMFDSNIATVDLAVAAVNDAPVAVADSYNATEDIPLTVPAVTGVLANDTDVDLDTLAAVIDVNAAHGAVVLSPDGGFTYTPNGNYNGPDSFTYHLNDGEANSNIATVNLTVGPVNDAPVAVTDSRNAVEDTGLFVPAASGVLANDTDPDNDPLTAVLDANAAHGSVVLNADGSFTYTPDLNYNGLDSFTYHANDGVFASNIVAVNLVVAAVNDPPLATADGYGGVEDTTVVVPAGSGVLANDVDAEGNSLTAVLDATTARGVLVLRADGSFTYTPSGNFNGLDSFRYHASDGSASSNVVTVVLAVTAVNDAPTAGVDTADSNRNGEPVVINVLGNDGDVDGDPVFIVSATNGDKGAVVCSTTACTYTPYSNQDGTDSFTYTLSDGQGATVLGTVNVRSIAQQILQGPVTTVPYTAPQYGDLPTTGTNALALVLVGLVLTAAGAVTLRSRRLVRRSH